LCNCLLIDLQDILSRIVVVALSHHYNAINSQKQLDSVDIMARKVGLKINSAKTEFMMVGNWASPIELRISTGSINLVKVLKYSGCWVLNCTKDFEIRRPVLDKLKSGRATLSLVLSK
jgi:hypothetical protein